MKKFDFNLMKKGWFVGNFKPTAFKTKDCEVAYVRHFKDQEWEKHFHKIATEITFIIKGKIKINDTVFSSGDIFVIEPNEIVDPRFLEDSEVVIVKVPSDINDKYDIER
jgi:quercetin dioxygenase-like cupin family protein